jgi:outer membrane scaffolding protein for murein synthesis (MipA/OmpV family)
MTNRLLPFGLAAFLAPTVAQAQSATAPEGSVLDGDHVTIGAGVVYGPSYEGSDDYVVSPIPVVRGQFRGIEITPRPGGIALDLIKDRDDASVGFSFGPVVSYSGNRKRQIEDPVVRASGKLKAAIEVGANAGVTFYKLLHEYDSVTVSADVEWDINGAHGGMVVSPQVGYFTPLSKAAFVNVGVSAKYVDDDYADYYYSVSPEQSTASGLPQYGADSGWASVGVSMLAGYDLDGDLLNGGFSIVGLASYSRLMNDAKNTPFTSLRGDADQWLVGAGVAYTF